MRKRTGRERSSASCDGHRRRSRWRTNRSCEAPSSWASSHYRIHTSPGLTPRGVFVGVGMMFKASFQIPGDTQPIEFKSSFWRMPNAKILEGEGATVADVYEKMATDGFDKFVKSYLEFLLKKPPQ